MRFWEPQIYLQCRCWECVWYFTHKWTLIFLKSPKIAKIAKAGNAKKKLLYKSLIDYIEKKKYHLRSLKLGYSKWDHCDSSSSLSPIWHIHIWTLHLLSRPNLRPETYYCQFRGTCWCYWPLELFYSLVQYILYDFE